MTSSQTGGPGSPPARRQFLIGAATLAGLYAVVFGGAVVNSLRAVIGDAAPNGPLGWSSRIAAVEWDVFAMVVVLAVVLRWLPGVAPDVARRIGTLRRPARAVPGGLFGAGAAYIGIAMTSGWLGDHAVTALHLSRATYQGTGTGTGGLVMTSAAAVSAGVTEEITLVAVAIAVVDTGWRALGRRPRWAAPATITLLLVLRWLPHLYYEWASLFVLFWAPGVYILYRWVGSVWPLVVGHITYDVLLAAEHSYSGLTPFVDRMLWVLALAGAAALVAACSRPADYRAASASAVSSAAVAGGSGGSP